MVFLPLLACHRDPHRPAVETTDTGSPPVPDTGTPPPASTSGDTGGPADTGTPVPPPSVVWLVGGADQLAGQEVSIGDLDGDGAAELGVSGHDLGWVLSGPWADGK